MPNKDWKFDYRVDLTTTMKIDEEQLRALHALTLYGTDSFLKMFYDNLGKAYLSPHEKGLRSLFEDIKTVAPPALEAIKKARQAAIGQCEVLVG
jgi:hypothetical protein